jgi:hypothetical protein
MIIGDYMSAQQALADWRKQEITVCILETLKALKNTSLEYLEINAGKDSLEDRYLVGFIAGINAVLNIHVDDIIEEIRDDS